MTNQELQLASVREVTGTAYGWPGDWHALFDLAGIPQGDFNGRLLAWINDYLSTSYAGLPEAMQAFAVDQGYINWSSMGTFDAGGFEGILDQLSTAPVAAWSVARVLKTDWLENALIRLRRASDNAESDFGADANGDLDTAAIATWIGGSSATIVRVYDQSGNGVNLLQTTAGSQLPYSATAIGGRPGGGGAANRLLTATGAAIDNLPTGGMALHCVSRTGAAVSNFQRARKNWAGNGWRMLPYFSVTDGGGSGRDSSVYAYATDTDYVDTLSFSGAYTGTPLTWRINGSAYAATGPSGGTGFADDSAQTFWAFFTDSIAAQQGSEMVLFAGALSAGDVQTLNDDASAYYGTV